MNAMANGMDGAGKIRCLQRHNESRNITLRVRLAKLRHNTDNDTVSFINGRTADSPAASKRHAISTQLTPRRMRFNSVKHIEIKRTTSDLIKLGWNMTEKYIVYNSRKTTFLNWIYAVQNVFWNSNNRMKLMKPLWGAKSIRLCVGIRIDHIFTVPSLSIDAIPQEARKT
jgi:hypothetical protein